MIKVARLLDDLRAARSSAIAFDSLTGRISAHLVAAPDAANEMLRQVQSAYDQKIIEPAQFTRLKTVIDNSVAQRRDGSRPASLGGPISRSNIAVGTRLRERFILDEVLGVGGMGTVYKGRDLLKVEARDRNPYVAIKVLNDDFKKRDDAFIVLQREASRQQRLAHPNIVTVYDFDRTGDIIFISMELLEGTPLDEYLKTHSRPRNGVPLKDALPLIEGMCAALTYAHERGIVHADFKPSNSFVLTDGSVKVLDFGIARAMKKPNQTGGDLTLYDGRSLGAMTPAYASPEMLDETADPDPRDDVYALACVCYELLTGWHPFNRASATDARDQQLVPKRVAGLSARQNRALLRALAFERTARTPSVRELMAELKPGGSPLRLGKKSLGAIAALLLLIAAGGTWYATRYPVTRTIADLKSDNRQIAQAAIDRLPQLSPADRAHAMQAARPAIVAHIQAQIQSMLDSGEIDVASAKAEALLRNGLTMYPDATELANLQTEVAKRRERYLSELAEQYETYLAAGRLLRSKQHGDIQGVMQRIQLVDPTHPLLSDPRVPGAFAAAADDAIDGGKLDLAGALIADGRRLAPHDGVLRDVADKLASAEQQARIAQRTNELAAAIEGQLTSLTSLSALTPALGNQLSELHGVAAGHPMLNQVRAAIKPLLGKDYQLIASIATIDGIVAMERDYQAAFEAIGLNDALAEIRARHAELSMRRERLLAQARILAAAPGTQTKEGVSIGSLIAELRRLAPADVELTAVINAAASEQRRLAQRRSAEHEWNAARAALAGALALDDTAATKALVAQDMELIAQRERDAARESAEAERVLARTVERMKIDEAKTQLQTALNTFAATPAGLAALSTRVAALAALDPGNPMIQSARDTAAQRIAAAADTAAKAGRFDDARDLLARAAVDLPGVAAIATARTQLDALQAEAARRAQHQAIAAVQQKFRTVLNKAVPTDERWQREADAALAELQKASADEDTAAARQQLAAKYLDAAGRLGDEKRFTIASQMLAKAAALAPKSVDVQSRREQLAQASERLKVERAAEELAAKVNATRQRFAHEINARQFERARKTLAELQTLSPTDPFATRDAPVQLANGYVAAAQSTLKAGDYSAALQIARTGATFAPGDARFAQLRADVDAAASRRIDMLLGAPGNIDRGGLTALIAQYKTAFPDRYRESSPVWLARIKARLAELANEPVRHNAYLSAVQSAFEEVPALQALRPAEVKISAPEPKPSAVATPTASVAAPASAPVETPPPASTTATQAVPANIPAPTPTVAVAAPEPTLIGKWCGDGLGLDFTSSSYAFELSGGRTIKYDVERYQRANDTVTMSWTDKTLGPMVTEFGDFSADGQSMVQKRGRTATSNDWKTYNRKFKRCR